LETCVAKVKLLPGIPGGKKKGVCVPMKLGAELLRSLPQLVPYTQLIILVDQEDKKI
jgi:hypothetical protein